MIDGSDRYSPEEMEAIRRAIAPPPPSPPAEVFGSPDAALPEYLKAFWKLSDLNRPLFERLSQDPWVKLFSLYAFFPGVQERLRADNPIPELELTGRTRGWVGILRFEDAGLVIKPLQNSREPEVARIAGELGVGPAQHSSLPGYLTEATVAGVFFTELPPERQGSEVMTGVGRSLGRMFRRLHDAGIYYNDASIADPEGRSHLLIDEAGSCKLIDFGVSLLLDRHPDFSTEEVHNFVRTLPMYRIFAGMADSRDQMDDFLHDYRARLARASKEEIMARDLTFIQQGLGIAAKIMGQEIEEPLRNGFLAAYRT